MSLNCNEIPIGLPVRACNLHQHINYGRCLKTLGCQAFRVPLLDGQEPVGHAQVFLRKYAGIYFAWLPRGPIWASHVSNAAKLHCFRQIARKLPKATIWAIHPEHNEDSRILRGFGRVPVSNSRSFAELNLQADCETRLKVQHGKWRNRLRRSLCGPLRVQNRVLDYTSDNHLLEKENMQRRQQYAALPAQFTATWSTINPSQTRMFLALKDERCVAFMVILLHWPCATYHIGWTNKSGRSLSAHNRLLWSASNWLSEKGYHRLDLGCTDPVRLPGLTRFKLGCGATVKTIPRPILVAPFVMRNM